MAKEKDNADEQIHDVGDKAQLEKGLDTVSAGAPAANAAPAAAPTGGAAAKAPVDITQMKVDKSCSRGLAGWLAQARISLAISSYQTGRVYLVGQDGTTLVYKEGDRPELLATNRLNDAIDASPAVAGKQLFLRAHGRVYCIEGK